MGMASPPLHKVIRALFDNTTFRPDNAEDAALIQDWLDSQERHSGSKDKEKDDTGKTQSTQSKGSGS
jgi:hypothetical protein